MSAPAGCESGGGPGRHVFGEGDHAVVVDRRGRRYMIRLESSGLFESHVGSFRHSELIGRPEGVWMATALGHRVVVFKPTMADFTREMPRIATVVYPKDLGAILVHGDIFPGARVLEAGSGSGALTIALLRAVGEDGHVYSYDVRDDMIRQARSNVEAMLPGAANLTMVKGDVYEGIEDRELDRMVLDLPEPWQAAAHASEALAPGGILTSFLPTVLQVRDLAEALRRLGTFELIETVEVLVRPWEVGVRSVRPSHRMVAHTGFITTARRCSPRSAGGTGDIQESR